MKNNSRRQETAWRLGCASLFLSINAVVFGWVILMMGLPWILIALVVYQCHRKSYISSMAHRYGTHCCILAQAFSVIS